LEHAKELVRDYRYGRIPEMNEELWKAKKSNDSYANGKANRQSWIQLFILVGIKVNVSNCTDTGKPVFLPWRMSSFVLV
jgi:sideroflexin-5